MLGAAAVPFVSLQDTDDRNAAMGPGRYLFPSLSTCIHTIVCSSFAHLCVYMLLSNNGRLDAYPILPFFVKCVVQPLVIPCNIQMV